MEPTTTRATPTGGPGAPTTTTPTTATTLTTASRRGAPSADYAWMARYGALRRKLAGFVLLASLLVATVLWLGGKVFRIDPGPGTSVGLSVRTDAHIATWVRTLEPYVPGLHRDGSQDRFSLAVFLVPLDGNEPRLVPVHEGLSANEFALARILGSDGHRLWVEAKALSTIDLDSFAVCEANGSVPANLRGEPASRLAPKPAEFLAAGYLVGADTWLGLLSEPEIARNYKPKQWVRGVQQAEDKNEPRRFQRAIVEPDSTGKYHGIVSMRATGEETWLNAGFLRPSALAEPLRLRDPDGALVAFTLGSPHSGTLAIARVDETGKVLWRVDTGIERFALAQILPGADRTAFVGTQPRQPDKVPQPLLVLVDHTSGRLVTHSLWR